MRFWIPCVVLLWASAATAQPTPTTTVNILGPNLLSELESQGFTFSEQLGGAKATKTNDLYRDNPHFKILADTIGMPLPHDPKTDQLPAIIPFGSGDVPDMVRLIRNFEDKGRRSDKDAKGGYFIRQLSNNSQHPYAVEYDGDEPRHFDTRWLNSPHGELKLIGVINRMDRVDFDASHCGEVRFIYRLSYRAPKSSSTLPFFLNVVKNYPKQPSCAAFAKMWQVTESTLTAAQLKSGALKGLALKQIELNFQSLRFTSGYMHDFGGQAMYMQRIFKLINGRLASVALENTPDVLAIERNPALLASLVAFLKQSNNLERLDNGTLTINFDPQFLAKLSVSWSTMERARSANKPYARLFATKHDLLNSIDISKRNYIKSHDALVERLDNLTCMGCHQSGGTAGFHMLGYANQNYSHHFNRQQLPLSPHAYAEAARRKAYVGQLASDKEPNRFRPHSNFTEANWSTSSTHPSFRPADVGELCTSEANFADAPKCSAVNGQPTTCQKTVTSTTQPTLFGECTVSGGRAFAGAVCWKGEITEVRSGPLGRGASPSFNFFSFQDKWKMKGSAYSKGEVSSLRCVLPQSGAPLGRASRKCTLNEENFSDTDLSRSPPAEICANQGGNGFDLCAASANSGACLESRVVRGMLDTCSPTKSCREDYICQKIPDYHRIQARHYGNTKNGTRVNLSSPDKISGRTIDALHAQEIGFCVPTYFLFNMRLDGHPSPVTGAPPGEPRIDHSQPVRGYK